MATEDNGFARFDAFFVLKVLVPHHMALFVAIM
jgi:hypothetical protein